jgi:hypothetical protein
VTLAPFVALEKPDLSPAAATSFSKGTASYTRAGVAGPDWRRRIQAGCETLPARNILILFNNFSRTRSGASAKADRKITFPWLREELKTVAQVLSSADLPVPICAKCHNFATAAAVARSRQVPSEHTSASFRIGP